MAAIASEVRDMTFREYISILLGLLFVAYVTFLFVRAVRSTRGKKFLGKLVKWLKDVYDALLGVGP
ncbi:MAG: hypothetical protein KIS67_12345 [Verrucomicrobiae bacterium]|nr:hypothetical protein [Verrucomicrobiae bacterium]